MVASITINHLSKTFAGVEVVSDLSMSVGQGEVVGFLGPNGAGKSTTMKMVSGFLLPSAGHSEICGVNVVSDRIEAQRHLGYLPEGAPAYPDITTSQYLKFIAEIRKLADNAQYAVDSIIARMNLHEVIHQPIGTLSKGYKRRVGLAQALIHDPSVLILDEPTDGLDPNQKHEIRSLIREISSEKAIIISTHLLEEMESVCTRAVIIANGQIAAEGNATHFKRRSPYYHSVSLKYSGNEALAIASRLERVESVASVETIQHDDLHTEIIAIPEGNKEIFDDIKSLSLGDDFPIQKISKTTVSLEQAFRTITTGDPQAWVEELPAYCQPKEKSSCFSNITDIWAITKHELASYFATPIAYVFILIFAVLSSTFTFFLGNFFIRNQADLEPFFQFHPWLYMLMTPAIAMRLWAEERKSGSVEILLTLPISTTSAVIGKFFAAWLIVGLSLLFTVTIWASVNYLGNPDNGVIALGYLGSFLISGCYLAIGSCVSAMTKNQVVAFICSALICFVFTACGLSIVLEFFSGWAPVFVTDAVANFSFMDHFREISRGVCDLQDLVLIASTISFFLFATVVSVEYSKNYS